MYGSWGGVFKIDGMTACIRYEGVDADVARGLIAIRGKPSDIVDFIDNEQVVICIGIVRKSEVFSRIEGVCFSVETGDI